MRPILCTSGTSNASVSKYLVKLLAPLTSNDFSVKDSFMFAREISNLNFNASNHFMASFDIRSLFTNIPVKETCDIILSKLFPSHDSMYNNFCRADFSKLLNICVANNLFLFNGEQFLQIDGAPMGGSASSSLADIFLCHYERLWLENCPSQFKPVFYRRYVDDTFLLFESRDHVLPFLNYLNSQHSKINFTVESENDNRLNFLDVLVVRSGDSFETENYRKPQDSGLGMKFTSAIPFKYKINLIACLLNRAFRLTSSFSKFLSEMFYLKSYFCKNNFPLKLVETTLERNFELLNNPKPLVLTAPKPKIYLKVPFMSHSTNRKLKIQLHHLLANFYPQIQLQLIFSNNNTIGHLFKYKDSLKSSVRSDVVYEYSCGECSAKYIGETTRHLHTRIAEHKGISARTGNLLQNQPNSNIYRHYTDTGHQILSKYFKIINQSDKHLLKISESLKIHQTSPSLNDQNSSIPLHLI